MRVSQRLVFGWTIEFAWYALDWMLGLMHDQ
jgi:hypothetical protein